MNFFQGDPPSISILRGASYIATTCFSPNSDRYFGVMANANLRANSEAFLQGLVQAPERMGLAEATVVGALDGVIAAAMLSNHSEGAAGVLVEYAIAKPAGVALAAFSALCVKSAVCRIVRTN